MRLTYSHFHIPENCHYSKPIKGLQGCGVSYRFSFNGQEKDNETYGEGNAYDFGARIYDARLGRWMSVDPLVRKYPSQSSFQFGADNPIIFIDKDGKEVFIFGKDAEKAVNALKTSTSLQLIYNIETGQIMATGLPKNPADAKLLEAINNPNIRVELYTTKATKAPNGDIMLGGSYEVSVKRLITGDDKFQTKEIVVTKQLINMDQLEKIGNSKIPGAGTTGENVLHEALESYIGGQDNPGEGYSGYTNAHKKALALTPNMAQLTPMSSSIDPDMIYLTDCSKYDIIDYTKDVINMGKPKNGFEAPKNPSKIVPSGGNQGGKSGRTNDLKN